MPYYTIDDTIPYGHGEKSVMMITEYMKINTRRKNIQFVGIWDIQNQKNYIIQ